MGKLSATGIRTLKPTGKSELLRDGDGLYLRMSPTGRKSWIFKFALRGKQHEMGLGPWPEVELAAARDKALEARRLRQQGTNPILERRRSSHAATTFGEVLDEFLAAHRAAWRGKTTETCIYRRVRNHAPRLLPMPVQEIDHNDVVTPLVKIWNSVPDTASLLRADIERTLDFATARGYRTGENPARWRGHLQHSLPRPGLVKRRLHPDGAHRAALPYSRIPEFLEQLAATSGGDLLRFVVLTATRSQEARGCLWSEIDFQRGLWSIPAARMKAGVAHEVPLSTAALALLRERLALPPEGRHVFPSPVGHDRPWQGTSLTALCHRGGAKFGHPEITVHGFRSSFRDWAAEHDHSRELAEMALAHRIGNAVEAAYFRSKLIERRRTLMEHWGCYCTGTPQAGLVLSFPPRVA